MFVALREPRFVIRDVVCDGDQCFLSWDFLFRMRRFRSDEQCIRGATHLRLAADGRIASTATTGTRPRSCTRSCPPSAA